MKFRTKYFIGFYELFFLWLTGGWNSLKMFTPHPVERHQVSMDTFKNCMFANIYIKKLHLVWNEAKFATDIAKKFKKIDYA